MPESSGLGGDCQINGVRYAVARDPKTHELKFNRVGSLATAPGDQTALELWDKGWAGGMGQTQEFIPDLDSYAFTVGVDCHRPGIARLHDRRVTVVPTYPPVDAPTWMFEAAAAGNAVFASTTFTKDVNAGTHTQTGITHGLSVIPAAILVTCAGKTASGTVSAGFKAMQGWTDGTRHGCQSASAGDNSASWPCAQYYSSTQTFIFANSDGATAPPAGTITNITSTTFDINWINNDTNAYIIHVMAIGGTDVSAYVKNWQAPAATGNSAQTGIGFQPSVIMHTLGTAIAAGYAANSSFSLGAADSAANQWALATGGTNGGAAGVSQTARTLTSFSSVKGDSGAASSPNAAHISMDTDGFTSSFTTVAVRAQISTLCLKGVRGILGFPVKPTGAATVAQAITGVGYAPTAYMMVSSQDTSTNRNTHQRAGIGMTTSTSVENCMAISNTNGLATSSTDGVDADQSSDNLFIKINNDTQTKDAVCKLTSFDSDGLTLSWTTNDAVATRFGFVAFGPLVLSTADRVVYAANRQHTAKMSVAANVITEVEAKDFGGSASAGFGCVFATVPYLPVGKILNAYQLTTVAPASGTDTWTQLAYTAVGFCAQQDGNVAKIAKAYSTGATTVANLVALSSDGTTYASGFPQGDATYDITKIMDTGTAFMAAKTDNLYQGDPTGVSRKITSETSSDSQNGVGMIVAQGTNAVWYNHSSRDFFYDGSSRPTDQGMDSILLNQGIPNLTHVPVRGKYYESALTGNWKYSLYRVTEASISKTYIEARHLDDATGSWVYHTYMRLDGIVRGMFVDSSFRLWYGFVSGGTYEYVQLGKDGSPDAGRDSNGHGTANTAYGFYGPKTGLWDANAVQSLSTRRRTLAITLKQAWQYVILTRNIDATCPVQPVCLLDDGVAAPIGAPITTSGISKRYWTNGVSDTFNFARFGWTMLTTAGYAPTTSDPQVQVIGVEALPRPDKAGIYHITLDTEIPFSADGPEPLEAKAMRDVLVALVSAAPVTVLDPRGNSLTMRITDISDLRMMGPNDIGQLHYQIVLEAITRDTPS